MSESQVVKKTPFVTYTVIGLCVLIYIWEMLDLHGVEDGAAVATSKGRYRSHLDARYRHTGAQPSPEFLSHRVQSDGVLRPGEINRNDLWAVSVRAAFDCACLGLFGSPVRVQWIRIWTFRCGLWNLWLHDRRVAEQPLPVVVRQEKRPYAHRLGSVLCDPHPDTCFGDWERRPLWWFVLRSNLWADLRLASIPVYLCRVGGSHSDYSRLHAPPVPKASA